METAQQLLVVGSTVDATTPRTIYSGANPHALAFAHSRVGGEGLVTFTGHISSREKPRAGRWLRQTCKGEMGER